ncbi:MAG: hypothetical protein JSV86_16385 [Gemmatimonadota bacterium]|nr:MAG: hypothetical protein JSV86_16385 [Gemmatimonadota bacterium]
MGRLSLSFVSALVIMYAVTFLVYGSVAAATGLEPPEGASPGVFLLSVLVVKIGLAAAFVLIFYIARQALVGRWVPYAFAWWLMFVVAEVGQAIGPNYGWTEAIAGIVSETVYCPLAALVTNWLLRPTVPRVTGT